MTKKKKIGLLNMRYDNNYGGNLQRFALYTILQRMGYDVEYLYIRYNWDDWFTVRSTKKVIKQSIKQFIRFILHPTQEPLLTWRRENPEYVNSCAITEPFLDKYIKHTKIIYNSYELKCAIKKGNYDAIVAGSDQIWRKKYVDRYGIGTFFMDFLPNSFQGKRIIYGASFGVDHKEYTSEDIEYIKPFFEKLDLVPVRETSALSLLLQYGLIFPQAEVVLDPTLLLEKEDYIQLIQYADTKPSNGNMFCYVLDKSDEIDKVISQISEERQLKSFRWSLETEGSVEQWLRSFMDAEFVVTDSYHGMLFSIIFNKPFKLIKNATRGTARFDAVLKLLELEENMELIDWIKINKTLLVLRRTILNLLCTKI